MWLVKNGRKTTPIEDTQNTGKVDSKKLGSKESIKFK